MEKFGIFSSSVNSQELGASVQGVIKSIVGILVLAGAMTTTDAQAIITGTASLFEQALVFVSAGYAAYGTLETLFGLVRKLVVRAATA